MEVDYKTILRDSDQYSEAYEEVESRPCCDRMEAHYGGRYASIVFGDGKHLNTVNDVCILEPHHYPEGCHEDHIPISNCPFCGADINLTETKRVKEVKSKEEVTQTQTKTEYVEVDD